VRTRCACKFLRHAKSSAPQILAPHPHILCANSSRPISLNACIYVHIQWWPTPSARQCLRPCSTPINASWRREQLLPCSFPNGMCYYFGSNLIVEHCYTMESGGFCSRTLCSIFLDCPLCRIPTLCMEESDKPPIDMKKFVGGPPNCKRTSWAARGFRTHSSWFQNWVWDLRTEYWDL